MSFSSGKGKRFEEGANREGDKTGTEWAGATPNQRKARRNGETNLERSQSEGVYRGAKWSRPGDINKET